MGLEPIRPVVELEKGIGYYPIPIDISQEVRENLDESVVLLDPLRQKVTFDDIPVFINPKFKVDEYNIVQDIKDQKENMTIRQLLYDNMNYQKLIQDA